MTPPKAPATGRTGQSADRPSAVFVRLADGRHDLVMASKGAP